MNAVSGISALNDESSNRQPTDGTAGNAPGALLRQEREQRGLTVQQVSEELHLDAWLVEALEQNRFLALGAPVYAKGHLRKYAMLLGLSPELILARYQEIAEPPPPLQLPAREALLTPAPMGRGIDWRRLVPSLDWGGVRGRTFGIIGALLVVAAGLWLVTNVLRSSGDATPQVAQGTTQPPAPIQDPTLTPDPTAQLQQPTPPASAVARPQPADRGVPASQPPKTEPAKVALAKPTVAQPPTSAPVQPAAQTKAAPAAAQPRVAATQPLPAAPRVPAPEAATAATQPKATVNPSSAGPAAATPAPAPGIPQVSLRLEFAVASWAEVYDGDGRRLLYAVGDPSRPRTVAGKPPLKVTLGQAGSVQARVNGRPIAIPRRIGQESASFSVAANGSIR